MRKSETLKEIESKVAGEWRYATQLLDKITIKHAHIRHLADSHQLPLMPSDTPADLWAAYLRCMTAISTLMDLKRTILATKPTRKKSK